MVWIEPVLNCIAYASTIIATLRAGSRACYMLEHDAIGVMDGPTILPPQLKTHNRSGSSNNSTSSAANTEKDTTSWELVYVLQQSIRLSLGLMEGLDEYDAAISITSRVPPANEKSNEVAEEPILKNGVAENDVIEDISTVHQLSSEDKDQDTSNNSLMKEDFSMSNDASSNAALSKDQGTSVTSRFWGASIGRQRKNNQNSYTSVTTANIESSRSTASTSTGTSIFSVLSAGTSTISNSISYLKGAWRSKKIARNPTVTGGLLEDDDTTMPKGSRKQDELDYSSIITSQTSLAPLDGTGTNRIAEISAYAPNCFSDLRERFLVSDESYRESIFASGPFISFQTNSKGAARAGGLFFFTRDGSYMIKTIKKEEARTFLDILPKYHRYMRRNSRRSLLTRFCGMYRVKIKNDDTQHASAKASLSYGPSTSDAEEEYIFIVMNSVFPSEASTFLSERFDLKGSTVGRECSVEERQTMGANAVLKDLDLAREVERFRLLQKKKKGHQSSSSLGGYGINIGVTAKSDLLSQLRKDVALLADCNVMDYSLLVGVVNMDYHIHQQISLRALVLNNLQKKIRQMQGSGSRAEKAIFSSLMEPLQIISAPPLFFLAKLGALIDRTVSTVLTLPLPYYGSGECGVYGGQLSRFHGKRADNRALYYVGLIDFLQPWTARKVLEKQLKGLLGYDTKALSCVAPDEYAARFIEFVDAHVS